MFGSDDAQRLLRDLVHDRHFDLTAPEMTGVVAQAWALGEPSKSGVKQVTWLSMFRPNGFAIVTNT